MGRASIGILGGIRVELDGDTPPLSRQRRVLLSMLIARAGHPVAPDAFADALWGDDPPSTAPTALRVAITHLRRVLGPLGGGLRFTSGGYALVVEDGALDADRFETAGRAACDAASRGNWEIAADSAAVALFEWRGPPFGELGSEHWLLPISTRLAAIRRGVVMAAVAALVRLHRADEALAIAGPAADEEPLDEGLALARIVALASAGRINDAVRACRSQRHVLADEVGLMPGPDLLEVERRVLAGEDPVDMIAPVGATDEAPAVDEPRPFQHRLVGTRFVGRRAEAARLHDVLTGGPGRGAIVGGPPGIGKTALVVDTIVTAPDLDVLFVSCDDAVGEQFRGIRDALTARRDLVDRLLAADDPLRAWLDTTPVPGEVRSGGTALATVRDGLTRLLHAAAGRGSFAVVLDDVQSADDSTLELVNRLGRSPAGLPVPFVLLVRTAPEPAPRVRAVLSDLTLAMADPVTIELGGLDVYELAELVGDHEQAAQLLARTGGSPFFAKTLARSNGPLPPDAHRVLHAQIDSLDHDVLRTLEIAAVVGERFELSLVIGAAGRSDRDVLDHIEAAARAGCVTADPLSLDHYAFEHALFQEVILDGMAPARRAHGRAAVARALAPAGPSRQAERALRALGALGVMPAAEVGRAVVAGVEAALAAGESDVADLLAERAAEALERPGPAGAHLDLIDGFRSAAHGDRATARSHFARAARSASTAAQADVLADAVIAHLGPWVLRWARDDESIDLLATAAADPIVRAEAGAATRVDAAVARALHFAADRPRAKALAAEALAAADADGPARLDALRTSLLVTAGPSAAVERRRWAVEAIGLARGRAEHGPVLVDVVGTAFSVGAGDDARTATEELTTLAKRTGDELLGWQAAALRAAVAMADGDDDAADGAMRDALDHGQAIDVPEALGTWMTQRFVRQWHRGHLERAIAPLRAAVADAPAPIWGASLALALTYGEPDTWAGDDVLAGALAAVAEAEPDYLWSGAVVFCAAAAWRAGRADVAAPLRACLDRAAAAAAVLGVATAVLGPWELWRSLVADLAGDAPGARRARAAAERTARAAGWTRWIEPTWLEC